MDRNIREVFNACWRAIAEGDASGFVAMMDIVTETGCRATGRPIPTIADKTPWDESFARVLPNGVRSILVDHNPMWPHISVRGRLMAGWSRRPLAYESTMVNWEYRP